MCLLLAGCSLSGVVGVVYDDADTTAAEMTTGDEELPEPDGTDLLLDISESPINGCAVLGIGEEFAKCSVEAPPEAFVPTVQWAWSGEGEYTESFVSPLVANLTDDDGDGMLDLCDAPDIVVVVSKPPPGRNLGLAEPARIYVLDGETGNVKVRIDDGVLAGYTPALGDVDGDGAPDIVAVEDVETEGPQSSGRIVVFGADGSVRHRGGSTFLRTTMGAVALADLNSDGSVEILVDARVMNARGELLFAGARATQPLIPIAADLDNDGMMEVVWGNAAARFDGSPYYDHSETIDDGFAAIADLDGDGGPEIFLATRRGLYVLDAAGNVVIGPTQPEIGDPGMINDWRRLAAVHDVDHDGAPEVVLSVNNRLTAMNFDASARDLQVRFSSAVNDPGGWSGATAFDFLGDGTSETVYADVDTLYLYDFDGRDVLEVPRTSITLIEFPVVADVDNDGSAEIVVVSNVSDSLARAPTVRVFGESLSRWVPSRRIWNQHTYHVTNIEEDGSVPIRETAHWRRLNGFRANVQIEEGAICQPEG